MENTKINDFSESINCSRYSRKQCRYNGEICTCRTTVTLLEKFKNIEVVDEFNNWIAITKNNQILIFDKLKIGNKVKIKNNISRTTEIGVVVKKFPNSIFQIKTEKWNVFKHIEECEYCLTNWL